MGDRAESETKLLAAKNEWEYGTAMQRKLAARLGYEYRYEGGLGGLFDSGRWVKKEA